MHEGMKRNTEAAHGSFSAEEMQLMLRAFDRGEEFFHSNSRVIPKMKRREREAAKRTIAGGKDVPALFLRMVCAGLEAMYWNDSAYPEGIPQLLAKVEAVCGYQRFGMKMIGAV